MQQLYPYEETALKRFEAIGKVLIASAAICYVCGLLMVNLYLRNFSFSDYSLLRTRFVLTGAVGLIPALIGVSTIYAAYVVTRRWPRGRTYRTHTNFIISSLLSLLILLCGIMAGVLFLHLVRVDPGVSRQALVLIFVLPGLCLWIVLVCASLLRRIDWHHWASFVPGFAILISLVLALSLLAYVYLVSQTLYPAVAGQLGGGRPHWVQLVLAQDTLLEAEQIGIKIDSGDELLTVPYLLLWEGETTYLLVLPNTSEPRWAAQVDKELVAAVLVHNLHQPERLFIPDLDSIYRLPATPEVGSPTPNH